MLNGDNFASLPTVTPPPARTVIKWAELCLQWVMSHLCYIWLRLPQTIPPIWFCMPDTWNRKALRSRETSKVDERREEENLSGYEITGPAFSHPTRRWGAQLQGTWRLGFSWVVSEFRAVSMTLPGHWQPAPGYQGSSLRSVGEQSWHTPAALHSPSHTPPVPAPTGRKMQELVSFKNASIWKMNLNKILHFSKDLNPWLKV